MRETAASSLRQIATGHGRSSQRLRLFLARMRRATEACPKSDQLLARRRPKRPPLEKSWSAKRASKNFSGIRLLSSGEEALASLIALADHAERTLDIQYYIIHQDDSTRTLLQHVRLAAERGVRVRLLVDDLNTAGEDRRFLHLSQRPNVEVRIFNPFPGGPLRDLDSIRGLGRRTFRASITACTTSCSWRITLWPSPADATSATPISPAIRTVISSTSTWLPPDPSWPNCPPHSMRSGTASTPIPSPPSFRRRWTRNPSRRRWSRPAPPSNANWLEHELDDKDLKLTWVPATVLADGPAKIASESSPQEEVTIANNIAALMTSAKRELIVISPYFVPGNDGVAMMRDLIGRGVHVRILTNSLASTDSPLGAHRLFALSGGVAETRRRAYPRCVPSSDRSAHAFTRSAVPMPVCMPRHW